MLADLDAESALPEVAESRMADVLETAVHKSLRVVAVALACIYVPFGTIPLLRTESEGVLLTTVTFAFAVAMLVLRFTADRIPKSWTHSVAGIAVGLLIIRSLFGWSVYGGESETSFVSGALMATGLVCLSWPWMVALNLFGITGWALIMGLSQHVWPETYMLLLLLAGPGLAVALRRARIEGLRREESFRMRDERKSAALRAAFHAVEQSEERFRGIVERINDLFCRTDLDGNIEMVSPSVDRYGYKPEELLGKPIHLLHTDPAQVNEGIRLLLEQGEIIDFEMAVRTKSGERREAAVSARVLRENGRPVGFEGTLRDISLRKRLAEQLRRNREELEHAQRLRIMGEMVAQMAHELNQPLAAINAYAAACTRRLSSDEGNLEKIGEALDKISTQALRAGDIIHRTRMFASKKPPRQEALDLVALIEDVLRLLEPETRQRGVTLRFDPPSGLPAVAVDRVQIQQVIANLILNGSEALEPTSRDRVLSIVVSLIEDAIEIAVRDSGRGLGAKTEEIFEPFFTTKPDGLGMGLAISRSIVEAHGGRLWATPNAEAGTTFHFTVPLEKSSRTPGPRQERSKAHVR